MPIKFSQRSLDAMSANGGIHPTLRAVLVKAAEMASKDEDFMVLEGVRSKERMMETWGQGRNASELQRWNIPASYAQPDKPKVTWLNNPFMSNHRAHDDGYGYAVDLAPYPIDMKDVKRYVKLYTLIMGAARVLDVHLRSGMDWDEDGHLMEKGETDLGHYELVL